MCIATSAARSRTSARPPGRRTERVRLAPRRSGDTEPHEPDGLLLAAAAWTRDPVSPRQCPPSEPCACALGQRLCHLLGDGPVAFDCLARDTRLCNLHVVGVSHQTPST